MYYMSTNILSKMIFSSKRIHDKKVIVLCFSQVSFMPGLIEEPDSQICFVSHLVQCHGSLWRSPLNIHGRLNVKKADKSNLIMKMVLTLQTSEKV